MTKHSEVAVARLPFCALCLVRKAAVDGKTKFGPWAFMCDPCHETYGMGLGLGLGQRLVLALAAEVTA